MALFIDIQMNWDNDATRRHVARYGTRSVWLTPWIQTTVKTSGLSRTYVYAVAIAWLMFSLRNCVFYGESAYT